VAASTVGMAPYSTLPGALEVRKDWRKTLVPGTAVFV